jgi:hypothetical protein
MDEELAKLVALSDGDLRDFWAYYANYLERMNIVSIMRMTIYKVARRTVEELNERPRQ